MQNLQKLNGRMSTNLRILLGIGLIGITAYDVVVTGFDYKHAIFISIAALAIFMAVNNKK